MAEPLHRSTTGSTVASGVVSPIQSEHDIRTEGPGTQSLDSERSHSTVTGDTVWLTTERGRENVISPQSSRNPSRESLLTSHSPNNSKSRASRALSPDGSDVDQSIEMTALKLDRASAKSANAQRPRCSKKRLSTEAKISVFAQLGTAFGIGIAFICIHLGFFSYLHDKPVDDTVSQGLQSAIANLLAFVISTTLASVIAVAYDQIIWRLFSKKFLKAKVIDQLASLTSNPWNIFHLELLKEAPWQWTLVLCCILVSIACNFPPGALTVVDGIHQVDLQVPTLNVSTTGVGTFLDFRRYTLFDTAVGLNYAGPRNDLKRVANTVLMTGEAYTIPGPCSGLCKYSLEIQGPYWDCKEVQPTPWPERDEYYKQQARYFPTIFSASSDRHYAEKGSNPLIAPDLLSETLVVQWYPRLNISNSSEWPQIIDDSLQYTGATPPIQINCTTKAVNYTADISYDERGHRNIGWRVKEMASAFNTMPVRMNYNDIFVGAPPGGSAEDVMVNFSTEASESFITTQLHTIHDAALTQLLGYLSGGYSYVDGVDFNFFVTGNGSTIGMTRFVHTTPDNPIIEVDITVAALQEYLFNVTLSTVALNNENEPLWLTAKPIPVWDRTNVYSFNQKVQFYVPYAMSLAAALLIAMTGIWCLFKNGASAGSGFLQIVATTRISNSLQKRGLASSRGGDENITEELQETKLIFGVQRFGDNGSDYEQNELSTAVAYGFGEEHEVQRL